MNGMSETIKARRAQIKEVHGVTVGSDFPVLVKFNLSAGMVAKCAEAGVPKQANRRDDDEADLHRSVECDMKGEDPYAFRDKVVDTGVHVFQGDFVFAFAAGLHADLVKSGRVLTSVEYFEKNFENRKKQPGVLQAVYSSVDAGEPVRLSQAAVAFMEALYNKTSWTHVQIWDNRNIGNPYTVNLVTRVPGTERAQNNLRLIDGRWKMLDR
jgi:hypothetical protein